MAGWPLGLGYIVDLFRNKVERYVSEMVTSSDNRLVAKIDRPAGIISFQPTKTPNAHLTEWASDISELLGLVEKTTHLIHKENMVHAVKSG